MNMSNTAGLPWYRYPMVWMIVGIPFAAVIMGVIMIWLAITTDDGLVADECAQVLADPLGWGMWSVDWKYGEL